MAYGSMTMEERLKEHIKEYSLENLLDLSLVKACFEDISKVLGIELLLTQRHGETAVEVGNFAGFEPDVVNDPGRKLRVFNRTIGHLYVKMDHASDQELAERIVEHMMLQYEALACDHYRYRETAIYADELEEAMEQEAYRIKRGEHEDALTGLLNKTYMKGRLLEMQETAPAAVICANINDWKFVYDHFGNEESDRLIKTVAGLIRKEAKEEYLIGRDMESNGKSVNRFGEPIDYVTGPLIFGEPGTNGQHSFYQLLHQGTDIVPLQFIGFKDSQIGTDVVIQGSSSQQKLCANVAAQIVAFACGKADDNRNKNFEGGRPSSIIIGDQLTPKTLGALLAHFENKVMFQGFAWNVNSFDQEGVQLGKVLAKRVLAHETDGALKVYSDLLNI